MEILVLMSTITEMKNTLEGFNSRSEHSEEKNQWLWTRPTEITHSEKQRKQWLIKELTKPENIKYTNLSIKKSTGSC